MPLAGRLGDRFGIPRLFMLALGAVRGSESALSGMAPTLDCAHRRAHHPGPGRGRHPAARHGRRQPPVRGAPPRASAGRRGCRHVPGHGAGSVPGRHGAGAVRPGRRARPGARRARRCTRLLEASWRWVFYLGAPLSIVAARLGLGRVARVDRGAGPGPPRRAGRRALDRRRWPRASSRSPALGETQPSRARLPIPLIAGACAPSSGAAAILHALRTPDPFLDPRLFRNRVFSGAMLLSLLTGYALATVIVGAAVFVDRVRYAGPVGAAGRAGLAGTGDGGRGPGVGVPAAARRHRAARAWSGSGCRRSGLVDPGPGGTHDRPARPARGPGPVRPGLRAHRDAALVGGGGGARSDARSASRARA